MCVLRSRIFTLTTLTQRQARGPNDVAKNDFVEYLLEAEAEDAANKRLTEKVDRVLKYESYKRITGSLCQSWRVTLCWQ